MTIWNIKEEKRYNRAQRMQGTISARCIPGSLQQCIFRPDHFRLHINDLTFVIAIRSCQVNHVLTHLSSKHIATESACETFGNKQFYPKKFGGLCYNDYVNESFIYTDFCEILVLSISILSMSFTYTYF